MPFCATKISLVTPPESKHEIENSQFLIVKYIFKLKWWIVQAVIRSFSGEVLPPEVKPTINIIETPMVGWWKRFPNLRKESLVVKLPFYPMYKCISRWNNYSIDLSWSLDLSSLPSNWTSKTDLVVEDWWQQCMISFQDPPKGHCLEAAGGHSRPSFRQGVGVDVDLVFFCLKCRSHLYKHIWRWSRGFFVCYFFCETDWWFFLNCR